MINILSRLYKYLTMLIIVCFVSFPAFSMVEKKQKSYPSLFFDNLNSYLDYEISLHWGNDPFRRKPGVESEKIDEEGNVQKVVKEEVKKQYILNGIFQYDDEAQAIINGERASVGKVIDGKKVIEIGKYYVLLEDGDSTMELILPEIDDKKSSITIKEVE